MTYNERVKYYIEECHLDIWDAVREATEDIRSETEQQDGEDLGDYPDTIHNQFDNMTGSMNL